ncbi:hypothetical protein ABT173_29455 [Streptomyces sp. NPDC001795]|uniref:hypothetical protein n=1 Tax=unclassified Streptomyces TaxID=2593676 RepID=UPI003328411E
MAEYGLRTAEGRRRFVTGLFDYPGGGGEHMGDEWWRTVQRAIEDTRKTVRLIAILIAVGLIAALSTAIRCLV